MRPPTSKLLVSQALCFAVALIVAFFVRRVHGDELDQVPKPSFSLTFDGPSELVDNDVVVHGGLSYLPGRQGKALKPLAGLLALPADKVLHLDRGAIALWVMVDDYDLATRPPFTLFDTDDCPSKQRGGWRVLLWRHPVNDTLLFFATDGAAPDQSFRDVSVCSPMLTTSKHRSWAPGSWHHVVCTWGSEDVAMYLDGERVAARPRGEFFPRAEHMAKRFYLLGSRRAKRVGNNNGAFRVDDFQAFAQALTSAHVRALYTSALDRRGPTLVAGQLEIDLLAATEGYGLASVRSAASGRHAYAGMNRELWRLNLRHVKHGGALSLSNLCVGRVQGKLEQQATGDTEIRWKDIALPGEEAGAGSLDVDVHFAMRADDSAIDARLAVALASSQWTLTEAIFPRVVLEPIAITPTTTSLVLPDHDGRDIANPFAKNLRRPRRYPSAGWPMPWFGLYDRLTRKGGLYFGVHDPTAAVKDLRVEALGLDDPERSPPAQLSASVVFYSQNIGRAGNGFAMQFPVVFRAIDGDWFDLARTYRSFALRQPWTAAGTLAARLERGDTSPRLARAGLKMATTMASGVVHSANRLRHKTGEDGFVLVHRISWDKANQLSKRQSLMNDTPRILPADGFFDYLASMHEANLQVAAYFDVAHWDAVADMPGSNPWVTEGGARGAVRNAAGQVVMASSPHARLEPMPKPEVDRPCIHPVMMCPGSPAWRGKVVGTLSKLAGEYPLDGYYLDVLAAGYPRLCFAKDHGHPAGGGAYWADGYRDMIAGIRRGLRHHRPESVLYAECFAEPYVGLLDGFDTWDVGLADAVPLAQAVYHDYAQFLDRYTSRLDTFQAMVAKQGQSFVWGAMPGGFLFDLHAAKYAGIREYAEDLAVSRRRFQPFVVLGEMLQPPELAVTTEAASAAIQPETPVGLMAVPSLAVEDHGHRGQTERVALPQVVASAWRSPEGSVGVVLADLCVERTEVRGVWLPVMESWGVSSGSEVYLRTATRRRRLGVWSAGGILVPLEPLGIVLVELGGKAR